MLVNVRLQKKQSLITDKMRAFLEAKRRTGPFGGMHPLTPYILIDPTQARRNVMLLRKLLPQVDLYYAIKSNPDPEIISQIDDIVAGYEIASLGEFEYLEAQEVEGTRVIYSNPVKVPSHIQKTYNKGLSYYAYDSLDEIEKLAEKAPGSNVYLRIKVSDNGSGFPLSKKFGVESQNAIAYIKAAYEAGLNPIGLTFHVGSQSENPSVWEEAIRKSGQLIKDLARINLPIALLDIGGGFPAPYSDKLLPLREITETISYALARYIPDHVRVIAEPGRFVSGNTSLIVTEVIGRERREDSEWLFLDIGVFQGLMEPLEMESWKYPIFTDKGTIERKQRFTLTGPSCDPYDTLGHDYILPASTQRGDKLYIPTTGAYCTVYASTFNGFTPPHIYYVG